jgi:hypothetical protein
MAVMSPFLLKESGPSTVSQVIDFTRLMPFSYFCTCWKVTPSASASSVCESPFAKRKRGYCGLPTCRLRQVLCESSSHLSENLSKKQPLINAASARDQRLHCIQPYDVCDSAQPVSIVWARSFFGQRASHFRRGHVAVSQSGTEYRLRPARSLLSRLRQLVDVGGDPPGLAAGEQVGRRATAGASGRWPCDDLWEKRFRN